MGRSVTLLESGVCRRRNHPITGPDDVVVQKGKAGTTFMRCRQCLRIANASSTPKTKKTKSGVCITHGDADIYTPEGKGAYPRCRICLRAEWKRRAEKRQSFSYRTNTYSPARLGIKSLAKSIRHYELVAIELMCGHTTHYQSGVMPGVREVLYCRRCREFRAQKRNDVT